MIQKMKDQAVLRDAGLLLGWIAGLLLIAGFCWFLTQPFRTRVLLRAVNQVLEEAGDSRRLGAPIQAGTPRRGSDNPGINNARSAGNAGIGSWYSVSDGTEAVIFTFIGEGSFFPCAAIVGSGGTAEEFIPLTKHGRRMIKSISPGILGIYSNRIRSGHSGGAEF